MRARSSGSIAVRDRYSIRGDLRSAQIGTARSAGSACNTGLVIDIDADRFQGLAEAAYAEIPAELTGLLDNVALFVEDDAPAHDPGLLGLYVGTPLTERDTSYAGAMPDRIMIYRNPILSICDTEGDVVREVAITVAHEIAHHFGIDDDRLHELGYA